MLRITDRNADNNLEKKQQIEGDPTSFQRSKVELIHDRRVESRDRRRKSKEVASMAALFGSVRQLNNCSVFSTRSDQNAIQQPRGIRICEVSHASSKRADGSKRFCERKRQS